MPNPFVLTSEESLLWESIRPQFRTALGEKNVAMTDAFAKSAKDNIAKLDTKNDYGKQLPLLVLFLKAYPEYIESTLPALYKHACKHNRVRHFLDKVHEHSPQILAKVLFNQDLTVNHILSTCSALGCAPEVFFCSLQSPGAQAFIPESFDFSESSPA